MGRIEAGVTLGQDSNGGSHISLQPCTLEPLLGARFPVDTYLSPRPTFKAG